MSKVAAVVAVEQTIKLGVGISIDGYMVCGQGDWQPRYGLKYIAALMGYSENYYLRLTKNPSKKLNALRGKGYTSYQIPVKLLRDGKRGASVVETISFDDFCLIVEVEAESGNSKAMALLTASFKELLRSRTQVAFGLSEDDLEQKQAAFEASYNAYLEREEILAENRMEAESLLLPGDEGLDYDLLDGVFYYPDYSGIN